ncbi:hypothetical protein ACQ4PT_052146 [Festuca glaucescens]
MPGRTGYELLKRVKLIPPPAATAAEALSLCAMEYRPRSGPPYGPNGYGGAQANGGYGGGKGSSGYAGGYTNGTYAGGLGNGVYGYGGGDGMYLPYGRGAAPSYGMGGGVGRPLAAAMPSTSYGQGRSWGAEEEHLRGVGAPPPMILPEAMRAAEAAAHEVVLRLHPTEPAERRRHEIIDYAKRLVGTTFGCEVHAYGSVPLRTYLPDGDVDVTVLTNTSLDSTFIEDVRHLLVSEAKNDDAQFIIKNVGFIDAKVKLIKCVIDNVVVDISFNQIGGISTVFFLEKVDREIGKNHLFKRSVILIKAWCYHEKNIHGSNKGLLSTYAVEVLILYILNLYHKSVNGPLEVLYKFLEFYSKFDWDKHCVTLNGPVPTPPPRRNFTEPDAFNDEILLSKESLKSSLDKLIVLPIGSDRLDAEFVRMYVNILDPLQGDNNLGRSISEDGFKRIKLAFECGARTLGQILNLPSELIPDEIYSFFATTFGRHGRRERPDLGDSVLCRSMPNSGNVHGKDVSSLENSYVDENEKKSPNSLLELDDKESDVKTNKHQSSVTSSTQANSLDVPCSCRVNKSNGTDVSEAKLPLHPFTPSNLLDLSGDLGLPLKCLGSVQYNIEALFDKLLESVKEASLAGVLDEDCFDGPISRFLSDTDGRKLSTVKRSQGTRDVPQQSITEAQADVYQLLSRTHIPSSGLPSFTPAEAYHHPWFQNTEDTPQSFGAGMYIPDMNFSLPPRTDTLPIGSTFSPAISVDKENYPFSSPYMTWDNRRTRGTGTYIPKTAREIWKEKSWYDRKQNQRQPDQVNVEKKPDQVNPCNGHAAVERALTDGGIKQLPTSETRENGEQRHENGSTEMRTLPPPRIVLPHHGGGSQRNLPVPSTSQPSPPAVTMVTPAATMATPAGTTANSQSITSQQHENLEFGTIGPFSATRLTAKFIEDFPPLAGTKKPVQAGPSVAMKSPKPGASAAKSWPAEATGATVQSPKAGVSATQSRPVEAPASTVPSESAAQCRPEDFYKLKDEADFPPLQAGTRYSADFPPLRAAAR